jgi:hypothetical protein
MLKSKIMSVGLLLVAMTGSSICGDTRDGKEEVLLNLFENNEVDGVKEITLNIIVDFNSKEILFQLENNTKSEIEILDFGLKSNNMVIMSPDGKLINDYVSPRLLGNQSLKIKIKLGEKKLLQTYSVERLQSILARNKASEGIYKCLWVLELSSNGKKKIYHSNVLIINYKKNPRK